MKNTTHNKSIKDSNWGASSGLWWAFRLLSPMDFFIMTKTPVIDSFIKDFKPPEKVKDEPVTEEEVKEYRKMLVTIAEKFGGKK